MSAASETNLSDASEHVSTSLLLSVPEGEALWILLAVIIVCILTLSGAIIWISCRLCAGDCSRRTDRSTPPKSTVYQWDSLTSQRK